MHSGVSKINVHHIGPAAAEDRDQHLIFAPINQRRPALDKFHPAVTEQIPVRPRPSFAEIGTMVRCGKRFWKSRKFSSASGRSILLATTNHGRSDKRG